MKAAVRWATGHARGEMLMHIDVVHDDSGSIVLDVLCQKHPSAQPSRAFFLVPYDDLRLFKDVEITGFHFFVAYHIKGGCWTWWS